MVQKGEKWPEKKEHRNAVWKLWCLILCHEFHKYLLDICYELLGAEDMVIKMDKVSALWKVPELGRESILWKEVLLTFCHTTTTPLFAGDSATWSGHKEVAHSVACVSAGVS